MVVAGQSCSHVRHWFSLVEKFGRHRTVARAACRRVLGRPRCRPSSGAAERSTHHSKWDSSDPRAVAASPYVPLVTAAVVAGQSAPSCCCMWASDTEQTGSTRIAACAVFAGGVVRQAEPRALYGPGFIGAGHGTSAAAFSHDSVAVVPGHEPLLGQRPDVIDNRVHVRGMTRVERDT